jgi:hypothetical protein
MSRDYRSTHAVAGAFRVGSAAPGKAHPLWESMQTTRAATVSSVRPRRHPIRRAAATLFARTSGDGDSLPQETHAKP